MKLNKADGRTPTKNNSFKSLSSLSQKSLEQKDLMHLTLGQQMKGVLIIEVQDSGVGIDKSGIEKLFKPFSTASDDHHTTFGGTGLGLWISKVIVELMGGTIKVNSKLDEGSTFTFKIPLQYFKMNEQPSEENKYPGSNSAGLRAR